jgi:integrase
LDKATTRNKKKEKTIHTAKDDAMLSQNTKVSYWRKLKACLNQAVRDHIIPSNPCDGIEGFKEDESERVYLTKEEVGLMWNTECQYPVLKRAFLFSCLTGLRKSDIERLHWGEVHKQGEFTRIIFRQKKTGGVEYIDLNEQAVSLMGERGEDNERVFAGFHYSAYLNVELNRWALRAGITKHISYHTSRHTFALMMLDLGVDIYTVSRLLGHKEINTTMVYAHILDSKKQEAMSRIPKFDID